MEILLAYMGIAIMAGMSFLGSAYGVTICGNAVVGAMKKNPGELGKYVTLSALPASQGLYGFIAFFMTRSHLVPEITMLSACALLGAGIIMGFAGLFSSIRQAEVCANGITAVGSGHDVLVATMVMAVFPELYAILALLVVILTSGSLPLPL